MSGLPMARNSRCAIAWIDAEIAMNRPSLVPYTLRGEVVSERLPVRCGFSPETRWIAASGPSTEIIGSSRGRSMIWPLPPRSTTRSATITA